MHTATDSHHKTVENARNKTIPREEKAARSNGIQRNERMKMHSTELTDKYNQFEIDWPLVIQKSQEMCIDCVRALKKL